MSAQNVETMKMAIIRQSKYGKLSPHADRASFVYWAAMCGAALNQIIQVTLHSLSSPAWQQYFKDGNSAFVALNPHRAQQLYDFFPFPRNGLRINIPESSISSWIPLGVAMPTTATEPLPITTAPANAAADAAAEGLAVATNDAVQGKGKGKGQKAAKGRGKGHGKGP